MPSLATACALVAGLVAASALPVAQVVAGVALGSVGLVSGPRASLRWRVPLAALALGLTVGWLRATDSVPFESLETARPVYVTARQAGDWQRVMDGWRVPIEIESVRQGGHFARWPVRMGLRLPRRLEGTRWRLRGFLRRPAQPANGVAVRPGRWNLDVKSPRLVRVLPARRRGETLRRALRGLRETTRRRVERVAHGSAGADLARALVLGEADALDPRDRRGLRRAGLAHLTALSGLHLGVLALWTGWIGRRAPPPLRWVLVAAVTLGYLALGGGRASLLRSWLMVSATGAAMCSRRPNRSVHALAWAAALLALMDPSIVGELAFQLTFVASLGVLLGLRTVAVRWRGLGPLAAPLGATVGAQLATLPFTVAAFHWLPLWSWGWNLLLVPVVAAAVPICFAWTGLAVTLPAVAAWSAPLLEPAAAAVALPGRLCAATFGGVPWTAGFPTLCGVAAALGWAAREPRLAVLALVCLLSMSGSDRALPRGRTAVHFIDVGQGDATLLRDGGEALLIDGGGWRSGGSARRTLLPALAALGLRRVEVLVLTHGDTDHCEGLFELAGYIAVAEVWMPPAAARSQCGRRLLLLPGVSPRVLWAGIRSAWRGWSFEVLHPPPAVLGPAREDTANEDSLVLHGRSRGRSLLMTGDIGHRTEFALLGRVAADRMRTDLLKVAHHGSGGSSSLSFVRAAAPALAVISVGRNNAFGHPSRRVLERFAELGVPVLRTDLSGRVSVSWSLGSPLEVRTPGAAM